LIAFYCLLLSGCGAAPEAENKPEIWRFAIEEAEGGVQHKYATRFKELIEERSGGEIEVIIYPYGTLGTSTHITEQLNLGVIDFAMASPGSLGKLIPELQVFNLHFVLPVDERLTQRILGDQELIEEFDQLYQPKGLKLLSIFSEGEMVWTTNQEIRSPEDFAGVKFRVMTSPLLLASYDAYGASATPMPYSEVYSGLQLKQIDGQVNPVFAIERQKFHEVTSWMTFPGHASFITTCATNLDFYNALSADRKTLLNQVIRELDEYIFEVQRGFQTERLKSILKDAKRRQRMMHISGDLVRFMESLSKEEHKELIEENEYVEFLPVLSTEEREVFRNASKEARELFLEIGGSRSREFLERLQSAAKTYEE